MNVFDFDSAILKLPHFCLTNIWQLHKISNCFSMWIATVLDLLQYVSQPWVLGRRVGIIDSWLVNHESISRIQKPKICKTSIFHKLFFPKYDDFKAISVDNICLSICIEWNKRGRTRYGQNSVEWFDLFVVIH